jgi:hypothetical protein
MSRTGCQVFAASVAPAGGSGLLVVEPLLVFFVVLVFGILGSFSSVATAQGAATTEAPQG